MVTPHALRTDHRDISMRPSQLNGGIDRRGADQKRVCNDGLFMEENKSGRICQSSGAPLSSVIGGCYRVVNVSGDDS
ncbi:hypothetical protein NPIL_636921 [Nephila pilipes]|uniref:Uncharacterized protein n=1 Tax=Nephila pilipes TaxID=299642 RepID=A0A8X6R1P0_NEPPI|nr:hypothetical protein NPIL_636921 [Nephila pilipes]